MINFKYFDSPLKNAEFTDEAECQSCGSKECCLEGEYFDHGDEVVSVCLKCLRQGLITVNIPDYIKERVVGESKLEKIKELEKTPPVPWVQYNDWPVCCGDFTRYLGEWSRECFIEKSENKDGLDYLLSMLDTATKEKIVDNKLLWEDLGENTVAFVFECLDCSKRIAILQSY